MPGPPGKRDEERRRRNKPVVETTRINLDEILAQEVEIPKPPTTLLRREAILDDEGRMRWDETELEEPEPYWEPLVMEFWDSFTRSGQAIWYEPSDWMTAYALMEILDRWLKPQDVKIGQVGVGSGDNASGSIDYIFEPKIVAMPGGVLSSILKGLSALMATEGDRRRLRIELERKKALDAALAGDGKVVSIAKSREEAMRIARRSVEEQSG